MEFVPWKHMHTNTFKKYSEVWEKGKKKPLGHFSDRRIAADRNGVVTLCWQVKTGGCRMDLDTNCIFLIKVALVQPESHQQIVIKGWETAPFATGGICWGMRGKPSPWCFSLCQEELAGCTVTAAVSLHHSVLFLFIWQLVSPLRLSSLRWDGSADSPRHHALWAGTETCSLLGVQEQPSKDKREAGDPEGREHCSHSLRDPTKP